MVDLVKLHPAGGRRNCFLRNYLPCDGCGRHSDHDRNHDHDHHPDHDPDPDRDPDHDPDPDPDRDRYFPFIPRMAVYFAAPKDSMHRVCT